MQPASPKVFISYSHDSPTHAERVLAFANRLRTDGIDAILDQFEEFGPPEGWPLWMTRLLREADFVVMICTERYYARVMGLEARGTGQGVRWEGSLILQHLYETDTMNRRFLPVLFEGAKVEHIPDPLRPYGCYQLDGNHSYLQLYRRLTNQPTITAAALGEIKPLAEKERRHDFFSEPPHNIPLPGPVDFVGRTEAFAELDRQTRQAEGLVAVTSVAGMAGVGKTELTIRYARSRLNAYSAGVCWAKVRGGDVASQILTFARIHFDLMPPDDLQDAHNRVAYCWANWPGGAPVLLVLDDVPEWGMIRPMLPIAKRFRTLITTRQAFRGVQSVSLDVLAPSESMLLLKSLIGEQRCHGQGRDAEALCAWLGDLPLGLELVGSYLKRKTDLPLGKALSRLKTKGLNHPAIQEMSEGPGTAQLGVGSAFDLSWEKLQEPGRELGCVLSLFAPSPIPWEVVRACFPNRDFEELEDIRDSQLLAANLLQRKGDGLYQLHQLVREYFDSKRESMASMEDLIQNFVAALVSFAKRVPQQPTLEILKASVPMMPHLKELTEKLAAKLGEDLAWPFIALQRLYEGQNLLASAQGLASKGLEATRARFGSEHPYVAYFTQALEVLRQWLNTKPPFIGGITLG